METIIKPRKILAINWRELWQYRQLAGVLAWRDIKVRYKQTFIGILWAVIQPVFMMIVFTFIFGRLANISSEGLPYPLFSFAGLMFWNFFSNALTSASNSLVSNEQIVKKIYFPRVLIPISSVAVSLVDFVVALIIFAGLLIYYQFLPGLLGLAILLPALLIAFLSAAGLGFFLASFNVKYRDVRYALPFFLQLLLFVSPVIYPISSVGSKLRWLLTLNPMTGVIESIRAGILQSGPIPWDLLLISAGVAIAVFIIGLFYFRKTEKYFADLI